MVSRIATVTTRGREALAGAIDRVHTCGIDDWRGGVRLAGKGPVSRWDGAQRKLIEEVIQGCDRREPEYLAARVGGRILHGSSIARRISV